MPSERGAPPVPPLPRRASPLVRIFLPQAAAEADGVYRFVFASKTWLCLNSWVVLLRLISVSLLRPGSGVMRLRWFDLVATAVLAVPVRRHRDLHFGLCAATLALWVIAGTADAPEGFAEGIADAIFAPAALFLRMALSR